MRQWDFRLVPPEQSLEAVGKPVGLHIIGRSKHFDLFPRTHKGKNRYVLRQKYALINSRERQPKFDTVWSNRAISNASCGWRGANNAARSRGRKAKLPGAQRSSERPVFFCFRQKMNDLRALHGQAAGNVIHSVLTRKSACKW